MQEFVLGDQLISCSFGIELQSTVGQKRQGTYTSLRPKGTKERNKEIIDFLRPRRYGATTTHRMCRVWHGTYAANRFVYGLGIHLFGETGGGKTTAMFTGTSIWGDPSV